MNSMLAEKNFSKYFEWAFTERKDNTDSLILLTPKPQLHPLVLLLFLNWFRDLFSDSFSDRSALR